MLIRERAEMYGEKVLSDRQLVSILVGEKAATLILHRFKTVKELGFASLHDLQEIKGVGKVTAQKLHALMELASRLRQEVFIPGTQLNHCRQVYDHYKVLDQELKERFYALLLNNKNRLMKEELVSVGSLNFTIVHPREVFATAIKECAASIVLVHNHPSGDPTPSREDISVTKRMVEVGKVVGIEVLDHIIIGKECYISFQEQKLL